MNLQRIRPLCPIKASPLDYMLTGSICESYMKRQIIEEEGRLEGIKNYRRWGRRKNIPLEDEKKGP